MMDKKLGGRLRFFKPFWKTFCSDRFVLSLLSGIKVEFMNDKRPVQIRELPELKMSDEECEFVDSQIVELLENECIEKLDGPLPNGWISNIFLVPKPNGKFRMILNLKKFNKHVQYTRFHLNQVQRVLDMVHCHDFLGSLDVVSAFAHVWVNPRYRSFFQFKWRDTYYCYTTMPQGFKDSPRYFVRLTNPVMAFLCRHMIDILIYIDDTFLRAASADQLRKNLEFTQSFLKKCGFMINLKKSCVIPSQRMEFLGFMIDTVEYTVRVTDRKRDNLWQLISKTLHSKSKIVTIRHLAKIIGKIVAFFPASDHAKLHYHTL